MIPDATLYVGTVAHKRLRPREHALSYRVFTLLLDVDAIDRVAGRLRLLSHNRFNLVSFHDRDHGPGDDAPIGGHIRDVLRQAGLQDGVCRILLLAYPRVLGYVFNPLSVYFALGADGGLLALVYEVNNTFGERKSYVVPAGPSADGIHAQSCAKELFVSPFASGSGRYSFRVSVPGERLVVGVGFRDASGPLIKTHFTARGMPLTDAALARVLASHPLVTLKVIAAIHYEAAKLWLKGVPLIQGHASPRYSMSTQGRLERARRG